MEIRRLKRLSGAAFALTSCAAMLAAVALVPMASAAPTFTYDDADNFQSGGVDDTQTVNLTVTKYRRSDTGNKPWGSVLDAPVDGESKSTPIAGAKFKLYQVNLDGTTNPNGKCGSPADLEVTNEHPGDPTPPVLSCGDLIDPENVAEADREQTTPASGRISWDLGNFGEVKYFVLQETNIPAGVSASKTTLFGLPYATFNTTTDGQGKTTTIAGHIYNVSVFPKDVSTRQFDKSSTGGNKVVQVGDTIPYSIDQTIYNAGSGVYPPGATNNTPGDGYLDVSEIGENSLRIVDRLSSALLLTECHS